MDLYHFPPAALSKYSSTNKQGANEPRMDAIIAPIAERHGVHVRDIKGPYRTRNVAYARFEAMHALMGVGVWSSITVGQYLGGRDHTTVLHGVRRHEELLARREAA